jgi:hypothetical protein
MVRTEFHKFRKAKSNSERIAYSETLKNHRHRNWRDDNILKQLGRKPVWAGLSTDEIHKRVVKPPLKGYWKYADTMARKGGISAVDHYAEVGKKYGWRQ